MFSFISRKSFLPHLRAYIRTSCPVHGQFYLSLSSSASSTSTSLSTSSKEHTFTVSYLITSCGLCPDSALIASKNLDIKTPKNPDSVLACFKSIGFTNTQIANMVKAHPRILLSKPKKTLLPKLEFLSSVGLTSTDLAKVITADARILCCSLENRIIPCYNIFRNLLQSDEKLISMLKRYPALFVRDPLVNVLPKIEIFREVGVPDSNVFNYLTRHPNVLRMNTSRFRRILEEAKEMGFDPLKVNFLVVFHSLKSMSKSTWEKKVDIYKTWGWSEDDILVAFGKSPWCMMASVDKIVRVMEFLINQMGMEYSFLVHNPKIISLSLEKRTAPRCLFYQLLLEKGLIKKHITLLSFLVASEDRLLKRITKLCKEEAPELLKLYQKKLNPVI